MRALSLCSLLLGCQLNASDGYRARPDQAGGSAGTAGIAGGISIGESGATSDCVGKPEAEVIRDLCNSGNLVTRVPYSDCPELTGYVATGFDVGFGYTVRDGASVGCTLSAVPNTAQGSPPCTPADESACSLCPETRSELVRGFTAPPLCE